jgi:hypothetical protein
MIVRNNDNPPSTGAVRTTLLPRNPHALLEKHDPQTDWSGQNLRFLPPEREASENGQMAKSVPF